MARESSLLRPAHKIRTPGRATCFNNLLRSICIKSNLTLIYIDVIDTEISSRITRQTFPKSQSLGLICSNAGCSQVRNWQSTMVDRVRVEIGIACIWFKPFPLELPSFETKRELQFNVNPADLREWKRMFWLA